MIELMVTIAVAAIMLAVAIPSFESAINSNRLTSAANEMMASLQIARMEALRGNRPVVLCLSNTPDAAVPTCTADKPTGWIVFRDSDGNGTPANSELMRTSKVDSRVQLKGSALFGTKVSFCADGMMRSACNGSGALRTSAIGFCIPSKQPSQNLRYVGVGSGSRIAITKAAAAGSCSGATPDDPWK